MKRSFAMVLMLSLCIGITINCKKQTQEISPVKDKEEILEKGGKIDSDKKGEEVSETAVDTENDVIKKKEEAIEGISKVIPVPSGNTYYVSSDGADTNEGTQASPWSLGKANDSVEPGDTLLLQSGTYRTPIKPARSGRAGAPIVYRPAPGATPVFMGLLKAIILHQRSYITIRGVTVRNARERFIEAVRSSHLTIRDCLFENAGGTESNGYGDWENCSFRFMGDYLHFTNNVLRNGTDLFAVHGGSHHLIEGNTFDAAIHFCVTLLGVQRSVFRGNRMLNPIHSLLGICPTRQRAKAISVARNSEYVLVENNIFDLASARKVVGGRIKHGTSGIQNPGIRSILRRNVFRKCAVGIDWTGNARANRFYNNVLYDCGEKSNYASGPGIRFELSTPTPGGNVVMNNIFYRNRIFPDAHYKVPGPQYVQVVFWRGRPSDVRITYNNIMATRPGGGVFWRTKPKGGYTIQAYEKAYPQWAANNIEADPMFVDPEKGDFRLNPGSPCIDAGGPLTRTRTKGKDTVIEVEDALFFCDGFGIVEPDVIRIGKERVRIVKVDYDTNTITVDRIISCKKGDPVSLDYNGKAPDIGAFEFGED